MCLRIRRAEPRRPFPEKSAWKKKAIKKAHAVLRILSSEGGAVYYYAGVPDDVIEVSAYFS